MSEPTDSEKISMIFEELVSLSALVRGKYTWNATAPINANGFPLTAIENAGAGVSGDLEVTPEGDLLLNPGGDLVTEKLVVPRIRFVEITENATLVGAVPHMIVPAADADLVLELDPAAPGPANGMYAYVQVVNGRAANATINPPDDGGTINGSTSAYTLTGFAAKTLLYHGDGAWQVI